MTASSVAVLPLTALITGPLLARVLGPYDRGLMAAVLAPMFVSMFVAAFAIPEAATYVTAKLGVPLRRATWTGSQILLVCGLIAATALYIAAPALLRGTPEAVGMLRQAVPCLPLLMYTLLQRFSMSGVGRYGAVAVERTTAAVSRLVLLVVLAGMGILTAASAVWINIGTTLLAGLVLLVPLLRTPPDTRPAASAPSGRVLRHQMLVYGVRGWGGVVANLVNWRLDQAILPALTGATNLGFYAVAVGLAELPSSLIGATKSVVFTEASARGNMQIAARAARVILAVSIAVDGVLVLAAPTLVQLLFGSRFQPSAPLSQLLLLGNIPFTAEVILAAGLLAAGRPGLRSIGQIVAAALTLVGLIILVPMWGVTGAAVTSLVAYFISFIMTLIFFSRVSHVPVRDCVFIKGADLRWASGLVTKKLRRGRAGSRR